MKFCCCRRKESEKQTGTEPMEPPKELLVLALKSTNALMSFLDSLGSKVPCFPFEEPQRFETCTIHIETYNF